MGRRRCDADAWMGRYSIGPAGRPSRALAAESPCYSWLRECIGRNTVRPCHRSIHRPAPGRRVNWRPHSRAGRPSDFAGAHCLARCRGIRSVRRAAATGVHRQSASSTSCAKRPGKSLRIPRIRWQPAKASQARSGVPASVTVAQAILESDWGASSLARIANNYFGIKATGKIGSGGVVWMRTWEVIGGQDVYLQEPFRAYRSMADSVADHARLFTGLRLYSAAMKVVHDPLAFAEAIHTAGYSTDPGYVSKLARLMDQYDLGRLDQSDT